MGLSLFPIAFITIFFFPYIIAYEFASTVRVDQSGKGQFKTIQDAINSVPSGNNKWFHINVSPGTYKEEVSIPPEKEYIFLEGSNLSKPIISSDNHISSMSGTFRSSANNFVAKNIKFVNSYNINQKINIMSAPAATIHGNKIAFYNCEFIGYQNTLSDSKGTHYYKSCYIEGAVDFIWGWGQSVFEECKINVTGTVPNSKGYITAQGRESKDDPNGFVFLKCDVDGIGQAYLGKPYGSFSRVIFIQSTMSSVVIPAGWDAWVHQGFEGDLTYLEAGCRGSGANSLQRVPWAWIMSYNRVYLEQFNPQNFNDKDGWIANTIFK